MTSRRWTAIVLCACASAYLACDGDIQLGAPAPSPGAGDASIDSARDAAADVPVAPDRPYGTCRNDTECGLASLHCDVVRGACVECRSDVDCTASDRRFCDTGSGRCVGCRGDGDCEASKRCETAIHRCVDRCSDSRPCSVGVCEEATGRCIECLPGAACADGKVCSTNAVCVECRSDADCAAAGEEPRCDPFVAQCVQCASNADCPAGHPCDPTRGECGTSTSN